MYPKVLACIVVDDATGMMTIEASRSDDEVGNIERKETIPIETARISLRQHEGLGDNSVGIDVTEIRPRIETVITSGTKHEPTRVGTPVVERLCVF